ncbi:TPA: hypothetical protein ENS27_14120 [bacterium]|nr:hypothetical protein [bacterium]
MSRSISSFKNEQKLTTHKGHKLSVFHPIPQKLVENMRERCLEQLYVQLPLGIAFLDNANIFIRYYGAVGRIYWKRAKKTPATTRIYQAVRSCINCNTPHSNITVA